MKSKHYKYLLLSLLLVPFIQFAENKVQSISNSDDLKKIETTPITSRWVDDNAVITRQFEKQPPLIPHKVESFPINTKENRCMQCHSWEKAEQEKATKVSVTHYKDTDGKELAGSRYFCKSCHVAQTDADPLMGNKFKPIDKVKKTSK